MGAWLFCFCEFSDDLGKRGQTPFQRGLTPPPFQRGLTPLGKAFRIF